MEEISRRESKARKDHICDWCDGEIKIGEIYDSSFHTFCGDAYMWKNHKRCAKVVNKLDMFDESDDGVNNEDFKAYVTDSFVKILEEKENIIIRYSDLPSFSIQLDYVCNHYKID